MDLNDTAAIRRAEIRDFTWKQLLDSYACTWCGRCHIACPAQTSGKPLSPRELILGTKEQLLKVGPALLEGGERGRPRFDGIDGGDVGKSVDGGDARQSARPPFIGSVITEEAVWACTTCRACQEVCPSYNEQMSTIVDLRRHLQMITTTETGRETLKNLRVRGHPWRGTTYARTDWAEGLDVKIVGEDAQVDVLYWVGCTQALEDRTLKVAQAIALLMKEAGVNFGILGEEEMCCGDPARRLGAEHIYQMMAMNNIQLLDSYNVKKIVTACPHCFNTLKNEYPEFGGRFEVIHHSEFLAGLVERRQAGDRRRRRRDRRRDRHLSGSLLPRPLQRHVSAGPAVAAEYPRQDPGGDGEEPGERLLLRRRRGPDVAGGERRHQDQRAALDSGHDDGGQGGGHRLPLLSADARGCRQGRRRGRISGHQGHCGDTRRRCAGQSGAIPSQSGSSVYAKTEVPELPQERSDMQSSTRVYEFVW